MEGYCDEEANGLRDYKTIVIEPTRNGDGTVTYSLPNNCIIDRECIRRSYITLSNGLEDTKPIESQFDAGKNKPIKNKRQMKKDRKYGHK